MDATPDGSSNRLAFLPPSEYSPSMTDKQAVMDALQHMPESASFAEITAELQQLAGIRRGRADVQAGRTKTQGEARQLLTTWASEWAPSK